jgi:hypothetical protein
MFADDALRCPCGGCRSVVAFVADPSISRGEHASSGALFRVASDGRLDQLHALTATYFTSIVVGGDTVYAGAADKGRR